jgi:tRNA 2-thiouridine synthesizing protein A
MMNIDKELDVRGLNCPLPILRTRQALKAIEAGGVLKVTSTDPGSLRDFEAFAAQTGNELIETVHSEGEYVFVLRKP